MNLTNKGFEATDRGYTIAAYCCEPPDEVVALVRFYKGSVVVKEAWVPADRIWSLAAATDRLIDALIAAESLTDEQDMVIIGKAVGGALSRRECEKHAPAVVVFGSRVVCPVCEALTAYELKLFELREQCGILRAQIEAIFINGEREEGNAT